MATKRFNLNTLPHMEDVAREWLENLRWPNGAACPHCGGADPYRLAPKAGSSTRKGVWKCRACRKQFTVTVGTIFESSHIPLVTWLKALYLLCASKKGMSSLQLQRTLGLKSYKSAWFMTQRLRLAMRFGPLATLLRGVIEADETYYGAKRKRGTKGGRPGPDSHKTPVVALVERGGRLRAMTVPRVTAENLRTVINMNVDKANSTLMTDEAPMYTLIGREFADHQVVNHAHKEYVRNNAYTNTAEGFFSLLKRGLNGTYHHVGRQHLDRYCDEFAFRYEHRDVADDQRAALLVRGAEGKRLTYRPLKESLDSLLS